MLRQHNGIARFIFEALGVLVVVRLSAQTTGDPPASFINWETPPVHPLALSPDGQRLVICNLPDSRLEVFSLQTGIPENQGTVVVGLDPVSVRFRTTNEVWVVNHISSSVSVVDLGELRVVATIQTLPGSADVVFAGTPTRAFVSCSKVNTVQILDPVTRSVISNVVLNAERPKALATSPDGRKVYAAVFESGNGSTILGPKLTTFPIRPPPGVVGATNGPYGGRNPPPNHGTEFYPAINTNTPPPSAVSLIVKKNNARRWMDDNDQDWTEFVSGTNSTISGRVQGWDLPDYDLAVLDTADLSVSYVSGLMNICMDVAVNPASGQVTVVGTDALNERRFEPNLRGIFLRVNLAVVEPTTLAKAIHDLNPHLDYSTGTVPQTLRDRSIGDPRGIVWNAAGTRAYITGMGSRNLITVDAAGRRVGPNPIELGDGPTGLALDESRRQLYVLNRFSASISVVDIAANGVITNVPLFDPTPEVIKRGRQHLYDTRKNSGLGHLACASCHVDARMDRLAWDLGSPSETDQTIADANVIGILPGGISPTVFPQTNYLSPGLSFHPMKGPMLTQTFQDIIGHEPFHWRGDRQGLEAFNRAFTDLLGDDQELTAGEMQDFEQFLSTIHFPPNPYRNFDNTLSTNVPVPSGTKVFGSDGRTNGDAQRGLSNFLNPFVNCRPCHTFPTGLGSHKLPVPGGAPGGIPMLALEDIPPGPNGEQHLSQLISLRSDELPFKVPQLRNLGDRLGMNLASTNSRAGFGFMHDGRVDTLARLVDIGFLVGDPLNSDIVAFLLSFSGSDLPPGSNQYPQSAGNPLGPASKDVPSAVGRQITLGSSQDPGVIQAMLALANSATSRVDLVVKGFKDGLARGWFFNRSTGLFQSDRNSETISPSALMMLATPGNEFTYTVVPRGSGQRIGIDRDEDGHFDRTELDFGSDPANRLSNSLEVTEIAYSNGGLTIIWTAKAGKTYRVLYKTSLAEPAWSKLSSDVVASNSVASKTDDSPGVNQRYYLIQAVE